MWHVVHVNHVMPFMPFMPFMSIKTCQLIAGKKAMHCAGSPGVEVLTPRCLPLALRRATMCRWQLQAASICSAKAPAFPMEKRLGSALGVFVHCENWFSAEICEQPFLLVATRRFSWMKVSKSEHDCICTCLLLFIDVYCSDCKKDIDYRLLSWVWFAAGRLDFQTSIPSLGAKSVTKSALQ